MTNPTLIDRLIWFQRIKKLFSEDSDMTNPNPEHHVVNVGIRGSGRSVQGMKIKVPRTKTRKLEIDD